MDNQVVTAVNNALLSMLIMNIAAIVFVAVLYFLKYLSTHRLNDIAESLEKMDGFREIGKKLQMSIMFMKTGGHLIYGLTLAILTLNLVYVCYMLVH